MRTRWNAYFSYDKDPVQTVRGLVEAAGRTPGTVNGRLDDNLVVEFPAPETLIGSWAQVRLTGSRAALLVGEPA